MPSVSSEPNLSINDQINQTLASFDAANSMVQEHTKVHEKRKQQTAQHRMIMNQVQKQFKIDTKSDHVFTGRVGV